MKKIISLATLCFSLIAFTAFQASNKKLVNATIQTLEGKEIKTSTLSNNGKPLIISFWATWCGPCKKELSTIAKVYPAWQKETGVKIITISSDDRKTPAQLKAYIDKLGWKYEAYLDSDKEIIKAMGYKSIPHNILLDGKGNIVYEHSGYAPGAEEELYAEVKKLIQ